MKIIQKKFLFFVSAAKHVAMEYSKKVKASKGVAAVTRSKELPVESDPAKLVNCCCINYRIGEQPIDLRPDTEYPSWLFSLNTERLDRPLNEVEKNTYQYWRLVRRQSARTWNTLASLDGWHRKDHRVVEDHTVRYYPEWDIITKRWRNGQDATVIPNFSDKLPS